MLDADDSPMTVSVGPPQLAGVARKRVAAHDDSNADDDEDTASSSDTVSKPTASRGKRRATAGESSSVLRTRFFNDPLLRSQSISSSSNNNNKNLPSRPLFPHSTTSPLSRSHPQHPAAAAGLSGFVTHDGLALVSVTFAGVVR
jgi:hypothetical protein